MLGFFLVQLFTSTSEVSYQALLLKKQRIHRKKGRELGSPSSWKRTHDFMLVSGSNVSFLSNSFPPSSLLWYRTFRGRAKTQHFSQTRKINSNQPNILLKCWLQNSTQESFNIQLLVGWECHKELIECFVWTDAEKWLNLLAWLPQEFAQFSADPLNYFMMWSECSLLLWP